ncbi:MAG: DUF452 family protein, partial [Muribaculaceae bacterium]|nr:DUF452 family protein [Muribaculaceae bacterium]
MHYRLISHNQDNRQLIFIFLGWAMDLTPFEAIGLQKPGFDIAVGYHYESIEKARSVFNELISDYQEVSVIAWSYGVAIADRISDSPKVVCRIAINGTPTPVNNETGIPERYHNLTLRMLSEPNMAKFYQSTGLENLPLPSRTLDDLRKELKLFSTIDSSTNSAWKKAYISECDAIFPPKSQAKAWESKTRVEMIKDGRHYVNFSKIIENDIIDKQLVAKRFSENVEYYESHASIQRAIAVRLNELWSSIQDISGKKVLELGIGTGFLTRGYITHNISNQSVAVDLIDTTTLADIHDKKGFKYLGKLVCDDAERYLESLEDNSFDAIVSASTIQWFNDLHRFFKNVERILKPGGVAAIATFAEGTFAELKDASDRSLTYPTSEYLKSIVPAGLTIVDLITDEFKIEFANSRQLLSHIKETGVNAVGSPTLPGHTRRILSYFEDNPHLTYRPLY